MTKRFTRAASLCTAIAALGLFTVKASAIDITGLVKVNGAEMPGVLIGYYDCADGAFLGAVHSGATDSSSGAPANFSISAAANEVRLELYYSPTPDLVPLAEQCRAFVDCGQIVAVDGLANISIDMSCDQPGTPDGSGVAGPGYWKNNPDAWPVDSITVGGRTYTKLQAIALMRIPEKGDKSRMLYRHLIAAKLNVLAGNDDSCIAETIEAADAWLKRCPYGSGMKASSSNWKRMFGGVMHLAAYNHGKLCAPKRARCESKDDDDKDDKDDDKEDDGKQDCRGKNRGRD